MLFYFDPLYLILMVVTLVISGGAQLYVTSSYKKWSTVSNAMNMTGLQVGQAIVDRTSLGDFVNAPQAIQAGGLIGGGGSTIRFERVGGQLTDHYDPRKKILRLSPEVYSSPSVAAAGIAAHESGHAIQDREGYVAMQARSAMVPTVQLGSWLGPIVFILGILMMPILGTTLAWIGVALFAGTALFAIVTLPVEFNASQRAKQSLVAQGIIGQQEMAGVNKVLDAAAMTYVAGAAQAISTLLYYVLILSGMGGRRRG